MPDLRAQVVFHFKFDPSKMTAGIPEIPDTIQKTVSVGDKIIAEKVSVNELPFTDRQIIEAEILAQMAVYQQRSLPVAEGAATEGVAAVQPQSAPVLSVVPNPDSSNSTGGMSVF